MMDEMVAIHFKKGDTIFKEGDPPGGVYLINQGKVEITKQRDGEDISLAILDWNSIFGEMALFDKKNRFATATALEDTWCYMRDEKQFQDKINSLDPFMRGIYQVLVDVARDMTEKYPSEMRKVVEQMTPPLIEVPEMNEPLIDEDGKPMASEDLPMIDEG